MDFDKDYCHRMNENPKMKDKLKKGPCGSNGYHEVIYGSLRYCPYFLQHPTLSGRSEFLRVKRACFKCLRCNHNSSSCKYCPASCYYCKTTGKSDKSHFPGLCASFGNEEFLEVAKQIYIKLSNMKKKEDDQEKEEKSANVFKADGEEEDDSDGDIDTEDDLLEALNCHKISRHMSLQQ